uniref:Alpha-carbonic anhydrase domain-containing protein n=1 Tax=Takifugu rubripes TaxID=31033 RepID=A0A674MHA7_TAKRU
QHGHKPFTLHNNGHTGKYALPSRHAGTSGGSGLVSVSVSCAVQMHLHWGERGARATGLSCRSSPLQLHLCTTNSELYPNMSAAMTQRDGLAVLAILIVTGEESNPAYDSILNYLSRVRHAGKTETRFDIQSLLPKDLRVTWTLFHERVQISRPRSNTQFHIMTLLSSQ